MVTFEGFEAVFGEAQGQLESSSAPDLLPFLFYLRAKGRDHLLIHLTDFHANTWYYEMSTEYLEDKKDDIGIGGSWVDFVTYLRDSFLSDNVTIVLKGSPGVMASEGATSASVVGQKAKGSPKIRVRLTKLQGTAASDAMGTMSVEMCRVFRSQAASLSSETARALQLSTAFMHEKADPISLFRRCELMRSENAFGVCNLTEARADEVQDQLDTLSFTKKKTRLRPTLSFDDPMLTQPPVATQSIMPSQFVTPSVFEDLNTEGTKAAGSSTQMEPKTKPAARAGPVRLRAAPISRRPKRRPGLEDDD